MVSPEQRVRRTIIWVAFMGVTAGTVIAAFSRLSWLAELFSHFRLYYLLVQALLILTFLYGRRYLLVAVTLALALPNAWYVGPYLSPLLRNSAAVAGQNSTVSLVGLNLNNRNTDYTRAREYLDSLSADVLVLQEYTPRWHADLAYLREQYPYFMAHPREGAWGMAMFSRLPLKDQRVLNLSDMPAVNLFARIDLGGEEVEFYGVHLFAPTSKEPATMRRVQLERLASDMGAGASPRLVIGDLNVTPFSPYFADLLRDTGLTDARRAQGLQVTWPTYAIPIWIPIDHCLADESVPVLDVRHGPDMGSDHYPLEVTVGHFN
jgi:endonuclease/exonuclease/phosphatase (EEP) superfamily protein YafD